jgi:GTPase SAR1 family protein
MLTGITLENFKAFKEPQFIPIKPITLVFGPNSAGKSSIIHALAFLKHVHQTDGDCNPGRMNYGWSNLDLGSWESLVFGQDKSASMKIKLHTETTAIQWCFENSLHGPKVASFQIEEKIEEDWIATAKGENVETKDIGEKIGTKGIRWKVEFYSKHWLWGEYKAALWNKLTERGFERTQPIDKPAKTNRQRETVADNGETERASDHDCLALQRDMFEEHFNLWLGDTWRMPPIDCYPFPDHDCRGHLPFDGLFPRRDLPRRTLNQTRNSEKTIPSYWINPESYYNANGEFIENPDFVNRVFDNLRKGIMEDSLTPKESTEFFQTLYSDGALGYTNGELRVDEILASFVSHLHLDAQRFPPEGTLSKKRLSSNKSEHQPWLKLLDDDFNHPFYSQFRYNLESFRSCYSIPDEIAAEMLSAQENHKFRKEWPVLVQKLVAAGVENSDINDLYRHVVENLFEKAAKNDLSPILAATEGLRQIGIQYRLEMRKHVTRMYPPGMDPRNDAEASDCKTLDTWDTELVFTRKSVIHTIHNLGSGVRVIVPVIVALVTAEAELLSIEEPECHVHPKLQAELGDLLIQRVGWKFRTSLEYDPNYTANLDDQDDLLSYLDSLERRHSSNTLVETHSEHLILRILRRIRETTEDEMDDWPDALRKACPNGIRPEDVSVLYVDPPPEESKEGSTVIVLPVTSDGDFSKPWPGGFFAERDNELF